MLAWIDSNHPDFGREVLGRLSAIQQRGATVEHYYTAQETAGEDDRRLRRVRILDAWRWFLETAQAPVLLAAEDDTIPDRDAYPRLLHHLEAGALAAQGTEVARQLPYVPHWQVTQDEILSASYGGHPVVPIQGGGWYCAAMVTEAARGCLLSADDLPLGPDVGFWRELARKGRCVGDWSVECLHFGENFSLHPAITDLMQVRYWRQHGAWSREERAARPYRTVCPKSEGGHLRVKVLKPFTGTIEERQKYAAADGLIHAGAIMEMNEQRFSELGIRPNPIVASIHTSDIPAGASLGGWAPVTKPSEVAATKSSVLATDEAVRHYLAPEVVEAPGERPAPISKRKKD